MTATAGAPSRDEIQETVERALMSGPPLPYDEHPAALGSARRRARLDGIRHQTSVGLGDGLISAQVQVRALATDCQWLLSQCRAEAGR